MGGGSQPGSPKSRPSEASWLMRDFSRPAGGKIPEPDRSERKTQTKKSRSIPAGSAPVETAPKKETKEDSAKAENKGASGPTEAGSTASSEAATTDAKGSAKPKDSSEAGELIKQADVLGKNGKYTSALAKYALALKKGKELKDKKLSARALHGAAYMHHMLGNETEALDYVKRSIALNQTLKNARARSLDYILSGRILMSLANYAEALQSFDEALKILPASETEEKPALLEDKAACLLRLRKSSEALKTLNRLLAGRAKDGKDSEAARLHVLVGEIHVSQSDYKAAKVDFQKAEEVYRTLKLRKEQGETLFRLAYLAQVQGDLKTSQKDVHEGLKLLGDVMPGTHALPLLVKGMNAYNEGNIVQAVKDITAALNLYERSDDLAMTARTRLTLANVQLNRSRLKSALELAGKALGEFRALSSSGGEAKALLLIGEVYFRQGFVEKAGEYAQESLRLAGRIGNRDQVVQARILLAEIAASHGDAESTSKALKAALEDARPGVDRNIKAHLRLAVARFRLSREILDKALEGAGGARQDFVEINDRRGIADCDHLMGLAYELRGERRKALKLFEQALKEHRAMWDRFGEGKDLTALGVHYKNVGDHGRSLKLFQKALDLRRGIGDRRGCAANLANIGNLNRHGSQMSEAVKNLDQALALYRELSDKRGEADTLTNLGHVDAARGAQPEALEKFTCALQLHREILDSRGIATDLLSIGRLHAARGDLDNAAANLEEARKINARLRNPRADVAILGELAMIKRAKRNPQAALALLNKALGLAREMNDQRAVSAIHLKMATVMEDTGDHAKALALLRETLETMKKQGDRRGELWALGGIGIIQVKMENYEQALTNLNAALKLRTELGLPPSQARDLDFYLGEIYEGFRDFEQALEHYQKALALYQSPGNDPVLGRIYHRIGGIYYTMEDYAKARDFFEDALRINSENRDVKIQKKELIRLGDISSKLGEPDAALKFQQRALALARESSDKQIEARILTRIGTLNQMQGRPRPALDNYRDALEIRTTLGDSRGVNENLLQIALVSSSLGTFDTAVADLKKAFEISQCSEDRSMLWKAYFIMGRTLERRKQLGEALESYRKAITILEAMEADIMEESDEDDFIFGGKTALFETTLRVLMTLAKKDPKGAYDHQALRIVERLKAAGFENTLSRINVDHFSDLPQELLIKEKSLKLSLRRLNTRLSAERSRFNPNQEQIKKLLAERRAKEQSFNKLKDRLVREYPSYAELRYPRPISVHQIQKDAIDRDEAIVEYMVTRSRTYLFVIDKQRFHTFSIDYAGKDLERDVDALMRPLRKAEAQASWDPSVAYRLYSRLIKPIEYFLIGKKSITIVPHGPLSALPFEILVSSKSHAQKRFWSANDRPSYLLEKYTFCYSPSSAVLAHVRSKKREKKPGWNLVAFGDAVYNDPQKTRELNPGADRLMAAVSTTRSNSRGQELKPLPGARREISEIVKIVGGPTQTYLGAEATETLFKKADLSRYAYVHLATHGVLLTGAGKLQQQPAIVFSLYGDHENDGFLQLGEVFGLKLNADMVVVSSCLTPGKANVGEASSLTGLSRAFLFAGADSVILSMWQVNDRTTAKLFIDMYRNLNTGSKAEALRSAKLELLKDPGTCHPFYWGPFVLMGNWHVRTPPSANKLNPENIRIKGLSTWKKYLNM